MTDCRACDAGYMDHAPDCPDLMHGDYRYCNCGIGTDWESEGFFTRERGPSIKVIWEKVT